MESYRFHNISYNISAWKTVSHSEIEFGMQVDFRKIAGEFDVGSCYISLKHLAFASEPHADFQHLTNLCNERFITAR
jgi:hypothetical protein